jgi:Alpha/beta hydrolase of unknown function (DUF1400)
MEYLSTLLKSGFSLIATAGVLLYTNGTIAAERIVFTYGVFRQSLSVDELTNFAQTGETSASIRYYLNQTAYTNNIMSAITKKI